MRTEFAGWPTINGRNLSRSEFESLHYVDLKLMTGGLVTSNDS